MPTHPATHSLIYHSTTLQFIYPSIHLNELIHTSKSPSIFLLPKLQSIHPPSQPSIHPTGHLLIYSFTHVLFPPLSW